MICANLEREGYQFSSLHPTRALAEALRKRQARHGDIFSVGGHGLWGYRDNFSPAQITRLTKKHAGMGGTSREKHIEKTRDGMLRAKAEGKRAGAKSKLTAEAAMRLKGLIAAGSSLKNACAAVGVTTGTYYNYMKRGLDDWKEGDPWPPEPKTDNAVERPSQLRVVK